MVPPLHELEALLRPALGQVCTAAVLRIEERGGPAVELACGLLDPERDTIPVTAATPFDLASITKVFTATAILRLVHAGRLELDAPVSPHLPELRADAGRRITIRHLLTHTSGLPALVRLFGEEAPEDPWSLIFGCELERDPGTSVVYSDVGFMLLGRLVEAVTGQSLRAAMRDLVLDPLALHGASYSPRPGVPATEWDPWRGRRIQGEVHDENAAVLGGAAGHAGLFGSAADVSRLARVYLQRDNAFLPRSLLREAIREQAVTGCERRGLGWKLASRAPDAPESPFPADTFGHYGFTGTAVWTDPARELTVVLLTNRVYYGRDPLGIARLRRSVFEAVAERTEVNP